MSNVSKTSLPVEFSMEGGYRRVLQYFVFIFSCLVPLAVYLGATLNEKPIPVWNLALLVTLGVAGHIFFYIRARQWRLRIDSKGIYLKGVFVRRQWLWESTGREIRKGNRNNGCDYWFPLAPRFSRRLTLWPIEGENERHLQEILEGSSGATAPDEIVFWDLFKKVRFTADGLHVRTGFKWREYSWNDMVNLSRNFAGMRKIILPDQSIVIRPPSDPQLAEQFLMRHLPPDMVAIMSQEANTRLATLGKDTKRSRYIMVVVSIVWAGMMFYRMTWPALCMLNHTYHMASVTDSRIVLIDAITGILVLLFSLVGMSLYPVVFLYLWPSFQRNEVERKRQLEEMAEKAVRSNHDET